MTSAFGQGNHHLCLAQIGLRRRRSFLFGDLEQFRSCTNARAPLPAFRSRSRVMIRSLGGALLAP